MFQQDLSSNMFPKLPAKRLAKEIDNNLDQLLINPADVTFTNIPAPKNTSQNEAPVKRKKVLMEPADAQ